MIRYHIFFSIATKMSESDLRESVQYIYRSETLIFLNF
jgi:hypothetical protein